MIRITLGICLGILLGFGFALWYGHTDDDNNAGA